MTLTSYDSRKLKERFLAKLESKLSDVDFIIDVVQEFSPEDVFPIRELEEWAEENGYVKALNSQ